MEKRSGRGARPRECASLCAPLGMFAVLKSDPDCSKPSLSSPVLPGFFSSCLFVFASLWFNFCSLTKYVLNSRQRTLHTQVCVFVPRSAISFGSCRLYKFKTMPPFRKWIQSMRQGRHSTNPDALENVALPRVSFSKIWILFPGGVGFVIATV